MMWLLPAAIAVLGLVPIVVAARRITRESLALRRDLVRFSELRPALLELRSNATVVRSAAVKTYRRGLPRG